MFPYVMLVTSAIFCEPSWPLRVVSVIKRLFSKLKLSAASHASLNYEFSPPDLCGLEYEPSAACIYTWTHFHKFGQRGVFACKCILKSVPEFSYKLVVIALSFYVALQCFLPWSHFITKGNDFFDSDAMIVSHPSELTLHSTIFL